MIFLKTKDGVRIAADFYGVTAPRGYLVLLHMMPATKESWRRFAEEMQRAGYASLAIDLRGHGQSEKGPEGYQEFSDREHQRSIADVAAAVAFLGEQGASPDRIAFVGASIGANLAFRYLSDHPAFKAAVLLSPGLNYRGIRTEPLVRKLRRDQRVMLIASRDDLRAGGNAAAMSEALYRFASARGKSKLLVFEEGGHGTDLLLPPERRLPEAILSFLEDSDILK